MSQTLDSFFKSQNRDKPKLIWKVVHKSLATGTYGEPPKDSRKVAAFDLDFTLTKPKNGRIHPVNGSDWIWLNDHVVPKLKQLHEQHYHIVIFSNQGGVVPEPQYKRYQYLYERISQMTFELKIPIRFYAACRPAAKKVIDNFRKPSISMWDVMLTDINQEIQVEDSFYVGDAAGRLNDFSDSDKRFASQIGLKFHTPDEFFL